MSEPVTTRQAAWRQQKPYAYQAHLAVQRAVKKGVLRKPGACTECGAEGKRIDAHHPDYTRPLHVQWLCRSCHNQAHARPVPQKKTSSRATSA